MSSDSSSSEQVWDLLGLGFGPANVAIAGAIVERWESKAPSPGRDVKNVLFIEKFDQFRWHPGMLLPDARMQISMLKDLATLRSPQSPITFLAYLHSQGRLLAFINRGSLIPTRKEFADYLAWAANFVQEHGVSVRFGEEVVGINDGREGTIEVRSRIVATGEVIVQRTRDIVISPGGSARIPESLSLVADSPLVIHSSAYCTSIASILTRVYDRVRAATPSGSQIRPLRVAVVGSGQSAAEVTIDLRERLRSIASTSRHQVDMILRKGSLKPSDDSPFANEIFDPASTDMLFSLPNERTRAHVLAEYKATNYGVVNPRTIDTMYEIMYDQKLDDGIAARTKNGDPTVPLISMRPYTSILSVEHTETGSDLDPALVFVLQEQLTREVSETRYDAVVCGTGYHRSSWLNVLTSGDLGKHFGLYTKPKAVRLVPGKEGTSSPRGRSSGPATPIIAGSTPGSPLTNSAISTPPSSPGQSMFASAHLNDPVQVEKLQVSRHYRLLPVENPNGELFAPRIYLQGCTEATHGLSDTLLSILGVRAGELLDDLVAEK